MTTLRSNSFSVSVVDPSALPSWANISSGQVVQVGSNTIDDVRPPSPGGNQRGIIYAWCGGTVCEMTNGDLYYIVRGGGHADYAGNEMYKFGPLMSESPVWSVDHGPSDPIQSEVLWQSDGLPSISHTRHTMVGGPVNELWMFGQGGVWSTATVTSDEIMRYVFGSGWDAQNSHGDFGANFRGVFAYNSNDGKVWIAADGTGVNLRSFNPSTDALSVHGASYSTTIETTGAIDTTRNNLLVRDKNGNNFLFDLDNPDSNPTTSGFSGTGPPQKAGIQYDAVRDRYTALDDPPLTTVYELNPSTLAWTTRSFSGSVSTITDFDRYRGHFNRWQYVPALQGTLFVGDILSPTAFYKS